MVTTLGVERAAGHAHCAGSDSLLTTDVLLAMLNRFFMNVDVLAHAGTIVDLAKFALQPAMQCPTANLYKLLLESY